MKKKIYDIPKAEKLEFNYTEAVVASDEENPTMFKGDRGHGVGGGGGCDHVPGHGNPHTAHPVFGGCN